MAGSSMDIADDELPRLFEKLTCKKVDKDSTDTILSNIQFEASMSAAKLNILERRCMNMTIELHETIRQIAHAVHCYDDTKSDLSWFSAVMVREYNSFELAERRRLSFDVQAGFVQVENCKKIVDKKVELIFVAVVIQCQMELSSYDEPDQNPVEKKKNEWLITRLRKNLKYLVEIVGPFVLKLKIDGDVKNIEAMKDRYVVLNRELRGLENYTVSPYNNEKSVMDIVKWDDKLSEYRLMASSTTMLDRMTKKRHV